MLYSNAILIIATSFVSILASVSPTTPNCETLPNKKKCTQVSSCAWDLTLNSCKPVKAQPSHQPSGSQEGESNCLLLKNKKKCNQDASCQWNSDIEVCIDLSKKPTLQPTGQPTTINHSKCLSLTTKKKCKSDSLCKWDDNSGVCISSGSKNSTSKPTSSPTNNPPHTNFLCLTNPVDVYRTCFQRVKDPSNNLTQDTILRDEYNSGSIAPYTKPFVTSDEELIYETIYLSTVRKDNSTWDCNEKIRLEEISLMWLRVSAIV
jgi:hypothetical protein